MCFSEDIKKREPGFLFVHPKVLFTGQNETVCLSLHDTALPTKVLVDLKIEEKHHLTPHAIEAGRYKSIYFK